MNQAASVSSFLCYCVKHDLFVNEAASISSFLCYCVKHDLFVNEAASEVLFSVTVLSITFL